MYRIGIGRAEGSIVSGKDLLLGGQSLSSEYGIEGARDGDVISLAMVDSLMGCANFGGIDDMFPESEFRGMQTFELLTEVFVRIANQGYRVGNVDIILNLPIDISSYITEITTKLSIILEINRVNIKVKPAENASCTAICICDQNLLTKRNREVLAIRNPN